VHAVYIEPPFQPQNQACVTRALLFAKRRICNMPVHSVYNKASFCANKDLIYEEEEASSGRGMLAWVA